MTGKNRNELKTILRLAAPAVVQEALATVVTYVDTAMVGALGASASATVGVTSTVSWLVNSLTGAIGVGVLAVCAQADGAGERKKLQTAGQQALFFTLFFGLVMGILCVALAPVLPVWLQADPSIQSEAAVYFRIISIPFVFRASMTIIASTLRGVSDMTTPMYINLLMNFLNMVLNFFLIYPTRQIWGITVPGAGWGVRGAAIATAIAITVGGSLMLLRYLRSPRFRFSETGFHVDWPTIRACLNIGLPVGLQRGIICMGHVVFSALIAALGVIPFAAHSLAIQAEQAFYIPGYGFQYAACTLVGNAVGAKDEHRVKRITYLNCAIAAGIMTVAGVLLFICAPALMSFFTPDPQVIQLGALVLRIVAVSEPIYGVLIILEGVFNGMGDTKAPVVYAILTMWGIRVLGTFIVTRFFAMGLAAVWVMMVIDNVSRCLLLMIRFLRGRWRGKLAF